MAHQTIPDLFLDAVQNLPRPDCFSYRSGTGDYVNVSSEEALQQVQAVRFGLKSLGVKPTDKVAILSENRVEWVLSDLGSLFAGAVTVPIYPTLLTDTIEYILKDCQPVVIFVSNDEQAAKIHQIRGNLPFLRDVISFETTRLPEIMTFDKFKQIGKNLADDPALASECTSIQVPKESPCSIIYTSGTTGNPKGVVLSHWNFVSNVQAIEKLIDFQRDDKALSFLPLSHVLERMAGYYTVISKGIGMAFAERMDTVPRDIVDVSPTLIISVPRLYEKIYAKSLSTAMSAGFPKNQIFFWARDVGMLCAQMETSNQTVGPWLSFKKFLADRIVFSKLRAKLGGRIRFMVSGGAPLAVKINQFFYAAGLRIYEGYGLTETSPVLSCNCPGSIKFGSVGRPVPGTEIRIAPDGEILARGPQVMIGYFNNDAATREAIDPEGWFATGDIGHLDEEGFLFITDRKKDIIVTAGGKNIAPQPIENRFTVDKSIAQMVVIGDRMPFLSALIVPDFETLFKYAADHGIIAENPEELIQKPEILALFDQLLVKMNRDEPGFNQIKKCALLAREFTLEAGELTPTMKVKRFVIARKYRDVIATMYPQDVTGDDT